MINKKLEWMKNLEKKEKKVKKKDVEKVLQHLIRKQEKWSDGDVVVHATNFLGNAVTIKCHTLEECYKNLATLNGYTYEIA